MNPYGLHHSCPKCSRSYPSTKYDEARDVMVRTCVNCGYHWDEVPRDKSRAKATGTEVAS